jgi:hypothetical protein
MDVGAIAVVGVMLAWVAFVNGYPLLFNDSARYIDGGIRHYIPSEAPIFYGGFLVPIHLDGVSLWPVPFVQGVVLSWVLYLLLRVLGLYEPFAFVLVGASLALLTAAPWFISFVMPDFFTAICVLGTYTLFRGWDRMSGIERLLLAGLVLVGLASHISHLVLGLGLAALLLVLHLWRRPAPRLALVVVLCLPIAAMAGVLGVNVVAKHRLELTHDGPVMLLARLFSDGPAIEYMRDHCAERHWRLCDGYQHLSRNSDAFLWSGEQTVWTVAGPGVHAEAKEIAAGAIREHPGETLVAMLDNTLKQLVTFRAGSDFKTWPDESRIAVVMHQFFPREVGEFEGSLQQRGRLDVRLVNYLSLCCRWPASC